MSDGEVNQNSEYASAIAPSSGSSSVLVYISLILAVVAIGLAIYLYTTTTSQAATIATQTSDITTLTSQVADINKHLVWDDTATGDYVQLVNNGPSGGLVQYVKNPNPGNGKMLQWTDTTGSTMPPAVLYAQNDGEVLVVGTWGTSLYYNAIGLTAS
jgi:hypothetical protein